MTNGWTMEASMRSPAVRRGLEVKEAREAKEGGQCHMSVIGMSNNGDLGM